MRRVVSIGLFGLFTLFGFSGCSSKGFINANILTKDKVVKGISVPLLLTPKPNTKGYTSYEDEDNARYKCSVEFVTHAVATKALEYGYPYFLIKFGDASNESPMAVNSVDKIVHYCTPTYFDGKGDFLDDKCHHVGFGNGTPSNMRGAKGFFFKERNPFTPMFDAQKTLEEVTPRLIETCWSGDEAVFNKVIERYKTFDLEEIDD